MNVAVPKPQKMDEQAVTTSLYGGVDDNNQKQQDQLPSSTPSAIPHMGGHSDYSRRSLHPAEGDQQLLLGDTDPNPPSAAAYSGTDE